MNLTFTSGMAFVLNLLHHVPQLTRAAYLDPGSGSYILQILIGSLLGMAFVLKVYWKRITSFLSRLISRR